MYKYRHHFNESLFYQYQKYTIYICQHLTLLLKFSAECLVMEQISQFFPLLDGGEVQKIVLNV